ncbi:MAG: signal peptidase I [Candidatus Heimdallarchaeota archaeon]|nr:signal peptidase I [Candidatus Heimdallarchaeota archaeon]
MSREKNNHPNQEQKSQPTWRKDLIEIVVVIGLALIIVFGFNWFLGIVLNTDTPIVVVTSESMQPTYWGSRRPEYGGDSDIRKDMLFVRGVPPSEIKVGDVIVFEPTTEDIPIVHRVTAIYYNETTGEYWFTTKGDNNQSFIIGMGVEELTINESRLIGKVIGRIGYLGGIISYLQQGRGQIILIVAVAILFIATIIWSLRPEEEDEDVFSSTDEKEERLEETSETVTVEEITLIDRFSSLYQKYQKNKQIIIPLVILTIIIFIPIIDTLDANWGTELGIVDVSYIKTEKYELPGGEQWFVFADVTVNNPGFWHHRFQKFTLSIVDPITGENLGNNTWTIVYNFEGEKEINFGAWVDDGLLVSGQSYNITATAHLQTKFGKTWTTSMTTPFTFSP